MNHPGAEENQDDYDFIGLPYVFVIVWYILLLFPMFFILVTLSKP